jgi:molybdenum-dependent DNA-binding transcriptional regulator ModE
MTAEKKLTHQRLSLLELAEMLGSVSEACRRRGVSRTRFYEDQAALSDARH